ncbi:MAG: NUDIX domain-containing protein [Gallionellaceae bacterium]|jgi:ADP-ribose pyrophosphatase YjhB (NUDIX family)
MKQKNSGTQTATGFNLQTIVRPLTSVDVVIFTVLEARLHVLLVTRPQEPGEPFPGMWALPGGFVDIEKDMDLEGCALRKLRQKTGIETPYLEQVGSWGDNRRDPRSWSATHVYFALIPSPDLPLQNTSNSNTAWFPVEQQHAPVKLAFDHEKLLQAAIQRLRSKVEYTSLPAFLLPAEFTLGDLQRMYEIVLERSLEKSAFRTRVFAAGLVEPIDKVRAGPNRPAQMYRLTHPQQIVYFPRTFSPRKDE